ncbi:hypothetical protein [Viridibacillus arvi]|uniref:hypothetical protein n=1 Tax=Viridibacillus arvi TaxID=263475 RepID=UPI0034CF162C
MKVLLAMYNVGFAKTLKHGLEDIDFVEVVDIISSEEDLLPTLANHPDITGVILTTDIAVKIDEKRLDVLVDVLTAARENFPDVIFTVLANERTGHPMLAELVEIGIMNIFIKGVDKFTTTTLVDVLNKPLSFATAMKFRKVDEEIPWRRNLNKQSTIKVEIKDTRKTVPVMDDQLADTSEENSSKPLKTSKFHSPFDKKKTSKSTPEVVEEFFFDDMFDMPNQNEVVQRSTIIGTVLIGVTGVANHLGSTFTAINIASYLKDNGYSVALVESNYSQDFDRIHALYEGEKKLLLKDNQFEMRDLTHFKYREVQDLNDIYSMYEYVVMDFGDLEEAANQEDFKRAHVKCVLCSADEWKFHWLKDFTSKHEVDNTYCFIVPGSSSEKAQDLQEQLEYGSVFSYPIQDDPYEPVKDCESVITKILGEFIKSPTLSSSKSKLALIGTSIGSILVTILLITLFKFLE